MKIEIIKITEISDKPYYAVYKDSEFQKTFFKYKDAEKLAKLLEKQELETREVVYKKEI